MMSYDGHYFTTNKSYNAFTKGVITQMMYQTDTAFINRHLIHKKVNNFFIRIDLSNDIFTHLFAFYRRICNTKAMIHS